MSKQVTVNSRMTLLLGEGISFYIQLSLFWRRKTSSLSDFNTQHNSSRIFLKNLFLVRPNLPGQILPTLFAVDFLDPSSALGIHLGGVRSRLTYTSVLEKLRLNCQPRPPLALQVRRHLLPQPPRLELPQRREVGGVQVESI